MDAQKRIQDLENQIGALSRELSVLKAERASAPSVAVPHAGPVPRRLSATVAVLILIGAAACAWSLVRAHELDAVEKTAIGYGAALVGVAYGVYNSYRHGRNRITQAVLGIGLSALYFTLFAGFAVPEMRQSGVERLSMPVMIGCFVFVVGTVYLCRASWAAAVSLASVYVTAYLADGAVPNAVAYAGAVGAAAAAAALLLHAYYRWMGVSWIALVGTYSLYAFYLHEQPAGLEVTAERYLITSVGFLSIVMLLFATVSVLDLRQRRLRQNAVAVFAIANIAAFYLFARTGVIQGASEAWVPLQLGYVIVLALFAGIAAAVGHGHNRITETYLAASVIVLAVALRPLLAGPLEWLFLGITCLLLACLYVRLGVVVLKALGVLFLAMSFVASFLAVNETQVYVLGSRSVSAGWIAGGGLSLLLLLAAALYDRASRSALRPVSRDRWFLQDSPFDIRNEHAALLHALGAAFILLTVTAFQFGENPHLPYAVAAGAVVCLAVGYAVFSPAARLAGVSLLLCAHAAYYFMLFVPSLRTNLSGVHPAWPVALAVVTFAGACVWERHIKAVFRTRLRDYDTLAAVPHVLASILLCFVLRDRILPAWSPLTQNLLGLGLFAVTVALRLGGLKVAAITAFTFGTVSFLAPLQAHLHPADSLFWLCAVAMISTYVLAERLVLLHRRRENSAYVLDDAVRTLFVVASAAVGVAEVHAAVAKPYLTAALFVVAVAFLLTGLILRERRYTGTAVLVAAVAVVRAAFYDLPHLSGMQLALVGILAAIVALSVTVVYRWKRRRNRNRAMTSAAQPAPQQAPDERTA